MVNAKRKKRKNTKASTIDSHAVVSHFHHRLREGVFILINAFALFLLLSLLTYHRSDPGWSNYVTTSYVNNAGGRVGAWLSDLLLYIFGYDALVFPFVCSYAAWLLFRHRYLKIESPKLRISLLVMRTFGFLFIFIGATGLTAMNINVNMLTLPFLSGGIVGDIISAVLLSVFNETGATIILVACILIGITLFTGLSWLQLLEKIGSIVLSLMLWIKNQWKRINWKKVWLQFKKIKFIHFQKREKIRTKTYQQEFSTQKSRVLRSKPKSDDSRAIDIDQNDTKNSEKPKLQFIKSPTLEDDMSKAIRSKPSRMKSKTLPALGLLDAPDKNHLVKVDTSVLEARSREVEERLADFGVQVHVVAVHPGPVVTRYELELAAGTKVSKISNLAKDLARSLSVISVRVVEVIPGKSVIGLELPNVHRAIVGLQEVLASKQYHNAHSALTLALGKDIAGHPVVVDLAKMPHLLVAGTTGSGKSVSINAMLLSLLYKSTPQQLRMIMIDPKMLELSVYDGIPHLLTPVVTDMKDAASALRWSVMEMERRYRLMASLGVRNIAGYNEKVRKAREHGAPLLDPLHMGDEADKEELQELPKIVVLADEFADMMVVVGKKVETLIARLAQKARAAGIHLILATQRPSVDVITGLIKANIPTRIAFQVSSKIDSRTILDQQGAEQLLGNGDMLYLPPGSGVPVRVHGAFVSDGEVHRVVKSLKESGEPEYVESILDESASTDYSGYTDAASGENDAEKDPIFDEAVAMVTRSRRVSISSIQRRFKIGYNRAARIVEAMEEANIVSKMESNGSREVLAPPPPGDRD